MKKSRFSEEQIIAVLKEHQAGIAVADICRKHRISDTTFYNWRSRYGGMEVSDARRLKALDDENRKLKKLPAESMLDVATLREALGKTSEARIAESVRELGDRREELFAASGLRSDRARPEDLSLCLAAITQCGDPGAAEDPCGSAAAVMAFVSHNSVPCGASAACQQIASGASS